MFVVILPVRMAQAETVLNLGKTIDSGEPLQSLGKKKKNLKKCVRIERLNEDLKNRSLLT